MEREACMREIERARGGRGVSDREQESTVIRAHWAHAKTATRPRAGVQRTCVPGRCASCVAVTATTATTGWRSSSMNGESRRDALVRSLLVHLGRIDRNVAGASVAAFTYGAEQRRRLLLTR
eukprot:6206851-Pleurochrysis_carterae.AAC.1